MGKKKSNSRERKPASAAAEKPVIKTTDKSVSSEASKQDLRKVPPVARMRGLQAVLRAKLDKDLEKLNTWKGFTDNQAAVDAALTLGEILNTFSTLDAQLEELQESGFSPARKSYTARANEGDKVTVLEEKREVYSDLMEPAMMIDMLVIKKRPGKGGGLIVEASDSTRMQVSVSHVVRLSKAA
jgi:hypothetical protein